MTHPIHVLMVEDNPGDVDLTAEILASSKVHIEIDVVADGIEAMAFLQQQGKYARARLPDLILLDLNLPGVGGREVLAEIKRHPQLRAIPVVVLTSSDAEQDIARSYELGANCYVTKPVGLEAFQSIVRAVEGFWFSVVKLP